LMGGLTAGEFGRMALVAVNTLFFSLTLGMCVSAMSRSAQKAVALTSLFLLAITALLPACGAIVAALGKTRRVETWFLLPSPGYAYFLAWDVPSRLNGHLFWYSMALLHVFAWLCLILASVVAPRAWQDKPAGAQTIRWRERW